MNNLDQNEGRHFPQRLDFYYQTIAIYSIVLLIYSILRGSIEEGKITLVLADPLSILLVIFIIVTSLALLFEFSSKRELIIFDDAIIFKSGSRQKKFQLSDIERIGVGKDRSFHFRSNYRTLLIKFSTRKRPVRIRLSSYQNYTELTEEFMKLKKRLQKD